MTLTSSGQIKMSDINTEFGRTSNTANSSLEDLSDGTVATINTGNASGDRPDGSAPHAMSEFYSYDHDLVTNATFNAWTGSFSGNDIIFSVTVGGSSQTKTGYGIFVTGSSGALLVGKQKVSGDTMDTTVQINISTDNFSSEGGFVNIADSSGSFNDGISDLSGNTQLYFKFKAIPHAAKSDSNSIYTLYLENNGGVNTEKELRVNASSFGGLCLHESIPVNTPNGDKLIGELNEGDLVYSYNLQTNEVEETIINEIQQPEHDNLYKVNDLLLTDDHPLFNINNELVSIEPELSLERYELESKQLKVGDKLKTIDNSDFEVMSIERYEGKYSTYTIFTDNENFYAGGILAHSEIKISIEII